VLTSRRCSFADERRGNAVSVIAMARGGLAVKRPVGLS